MRPSALSGHLADGLRQFAWDEWAQMGLFVAARRTSRWAEDPEALILFTLDLGRGEPRLFDELLDWLLVNEPLLSVRRLRALCDGPDDERLVDAALGWVSRQRPRARLTASRGRQTAASAEPVPLFHGLRAGVRRPDPAFASAGWLRPVARPSGKSARPDLTAPINLAFRLRELLGVGARAEAVRFLLTVEAPSVDVRTVARAACYAKRNVHEALVSLHDAGFARRWTVGNEQRYALERERWTPLLGVATDELPIERPWPQLLRGVRILSRGLMRPDLDDMSDYMRASYARDLLETARADLEYGGLVVGRSSGEGAWDDLVTLVGDVLRHVESGRSEHRPPPRSK